VEQGERVEEIGDPLPVARFQQDLPFAVEVRLAREPLPEVLPGLFEGQKGLAGPGQIAALPGQAQGRYVGSVQGGHRGDQLRLNRGQRSGPDGPQYQHRGDSSFHIQFNIYRLLLPAKAFCANIDKPGGIVQCLSVAAVVLQPGQGVLQGGLHTRTAHGECSSGG